LVRFFTNDFWKTNNLTVQSAVGIVMQMREIVAMAHYHHALLVDGNEMNYIVRNHVGYQPFVIDVDSWQIGKFKATAIMPSIRDYNATDFSPGTDWFSWAIVTFQLLAGIHPYKGKHPDYKPNELEKRMRDRVCVFNPKVHVPAVTRPFDAIPSALKEWYEAVFSTAVRDAPPKQLNVTAGPRKAKVVATYTSSGKIQFDKIADYNEEIIKVFPSGHVWTLHEIHGKDPLPYLRFSYAATRGYGNLLQHDLGLVLIGGKNTAQLCTAPKSIYDVQIPMSFESLFVKDKRIFAMHPHGMTELNPLQHSRRGEGVWQELRGISTHVRPLLVKVSSFTTP
jgi:hypothetical protein